MSATCQIVFRLCDFFQSLSLCVLFLECRIIFFFNGYAIKEFRLNNTLTTADEFVMGDDNFKDFQTLTAPNLTVLP